MISLHIDIETFSDVDLNACGVYKYVESPRFEILMLAYAYNNEPVKIVDLARGEQLPDDIRRAILLNTQKKAWNANFERVCLAKHFNMPALPPETWECSMVKAGMIGLPFSLDKAGTALKIKEQKDLSGKALIRYFCIPCKPTQTNGMRARNLPEHDLEKWELFKEYCKRDVAAEREIDNRIAFFQIPEQEAYLWQIDQRINDRGIRIDQQFIQNAMRIDAEHREKLMAEAVAITGLRNPNSVKQLTSWLQIEMPLDVINKLRKDDIPLLIEKSEEYTNSEMLTRVLTIRKEMSKTSTKKYGAMLAYVCADGRVRGLLQFYGAGRTGRWAGRGIQVHNLPRNSLKDLDLARRYVAANDGQSLEFLFADVPDTLSQLIRTAFVASLGEHFKVSDFKAIEARVLAWLAKEKWRLEIFATHGMIYEASGSKMFKVPIEAVDKESQWRQWAKVSELSLGFQGGVKALEKMGALKAGLTKKELPGIVHAWRVENPAIVKYWTIVNDAAIAAVEQPGIAIVIDHGIRFQVRNGVLFIKLPSGRELAYPGPALIKTLVVFVVFKEDHGPFEQDQKIMLPVLKAKILAEGGTVAITSEPFVNTAVSYQGMNQTTKQWGTQVTYGGKLVENITQATARDCLAEKIIAVHEKGYRICMHVHDEIVAEVPDGMGTLKELNKILSMPIPWARGLPLDADGFEGKYYKK